MDKNKETKFTDKELESLKKLQESYIGVQSRFGQLAVARINLKQQADELVRVEEEIRDEFLKTQEDERELVAKLTEKYGEGNLDPQTGVFTPNKTSDS